MISLTSSDYTLRFRWCYILVVQTNCSM